MSYKRLTKRDEEFGIIALCHACSRKATCEKQEECVDCLDEMQERLAELEDKIEQGKMLELPCKVGDEIFEIIDSPRGMFISKEIIGEFVWNEYGFTIRTGLYTTDFIDLEQFGKTVFLTKAEAEQKLKEQQNER